MNTNYFLYGNIIFATFMGYKCRNGMVYEDINPNKEPKIYWNNRPKNFQSQEELKYNSSWDWLMPVINKISLILKDHLSNPEYEEQWKLLYDYQSYNFFINDINPVYTACVDFINWYNLKTKI